MSDSNFEAMSNPDKFPISDGCFAAERPRKLTYRKYFNQRILDVDGRFAKDIDYPFVAQYVVEAKQIVTEARQRFYSPTNQRPVYYQSVFTQR